jgi:hypothetical protein
MLIAMSCQCGASLELDGADDTFALLMANRFADSHTKCGFMTTTKADSPTSTVRHEIKFKPKAYQDDEE